MTDNFNALLSFCLQLTSDYIYIDGLGQDCGNSSALAMELPQSCAKP